MTTSITHDTTNLISVESTHSVASSRKTPLRLVIPQFLLDKLKVHPLTKSLYPLVVGDYQESHNFVVSKQQNEHHLLIYCYEGSGELIVDGNKQKVSRGDIVLIPPTLLHSFSGNAKAPWSVYWVQFTGELSDDFFKRLYMKMPNYKANIGHIPQVIDDFNQLIQLSGKGYTATNVIYAVHVLQHLLSFLALQLRLNPQHGQQLNLAAIENFMLENLNRDMSLEELADYCQLSKFHFSKKFKALTDNSPIQHFIHLKMERACHLLDTSEDSVKQIAASLGYNDPYYFSRLYKRVIGMSPMQFRKSKQLTK